ncbi:glutathione peroxidase [Clostridium cellulovorans]|uniref:Glutathione peroxidase n=1 Tax=Clostridium cellulovorans (strain ATCC 35296 / DSM 3052 / OCM 3 / 743B) TaxID=573061 RepID=D9SN85_CLOC7|nr:glutathione peroxidase [Clostridium cellulovorans]ADL53877.1 Peroxiredoxin [Clostridium cellulovorans 743B]
MNIYDFNVKDINGKEVSLSNYRGKVLLIVNTASKCGFTPQYEDLENLYKKFGNDKLEILAFPCNQFGNQEPGDNAAIKNFCQSTYDVTFPMFAKVNVNGDDADPLYKYLTTAKKGLLGGGVKWNFTKFLVDAEGNVVDRFAPTTKPSKIEETIESLIKKA